jgi:predicted transcriptional regulator of viral defense system
MPGNIYAVLAEFAGERHGFVTPDDARDLGVNPMNLVRLAERGQIERRGNGVYRFPLVPPSSFDAYMEATLWPRTHAGILSHQTALSIYDLSDVNPSKIHITLPRSHRVRRTIPASYRLHHEDLEPKQVTRVEGIPIVTPDHAIRQTHRAHLGAALVAQAIDHGERSGRLTRQQAKSLWNETGVNPGDGSRR